MKPTPFAEIEIPDSLTIGTYIYHQDSNVRVNNNTVRIPCCVMQINGTVANAQSIDEGIYYPIDFSKAGYKHTFSHCPTSEAIAYAKKVVAKRDERIKEYRDQLDLELRESAKLELLLKGMSLWLLLKK